MSMISRIPTLVFLFIAYNLVIFLGHAEWLNTIVFNINMMSGAHLEIAGHHVFIFAGLALLYIEIFKATRSHQVSLMEQSFSLLLFMLFLVEFLMVEAAGSSTFLVLTLLQLLDVMAGFTVSVSAARRDISIA